MPKARPRRFPRPRRRPDRGSTPPASVSQPAAPTAVLVPEGRAPVVLPRTIQVGELARSFERSVVDVMQALVNLGLMVTINQTVDYDTAALVAGELGIEVTPEEQPAVAEAEAEEAVPAVREALWTDEDPSRLRERAPV